MSLQIQNYSLPKTAQAFNALSFGKGGNANKTLGLAEDNLASNQITLTLNGKKPATYQNLTEEEVSAVKKAEKYLDKATFSILYGENPFAEKTVVFLINKPLLKETVAPHLGYFKYRLNNDDLTVEKLVENLASKDSPLLDVRNNDDLIGIALGYPFADSLIYQTKKQTRHKLSYLNTFGMRNSKQAELLRHINSTIRSSGKNCATKNNTAFATWG